MLLSDIGEGSNALFCLTDRTQCCTTEAGLNKGGWRFPNSDNVDTEEFYRTRGHSSVLLNRRSNAMDPTGIFTCRIPTNQSKDNTDLYIGVYDDAGEGVLGMHCLLYTSHLSLPSGSLTASLSYDPTSHTLTCVSSGGPVNTVTWTRNGADIFSSPYQLRQSLEDGMTSTYHNLLTVTSGDVEDYIGSFNCTVSNSRGNSPPQSVDINGMLKSMLLSHQIFCADISVSGNMMLHQFQSSVTITCFSDLAVQTIRWLNDSDNGQELIRNSGQQPLLLPIENAILNLDNTMYTCEVQVILATGVETIQEMITFRVNISNNDTNQ